MKRFKDDLQFLSEHADDITPKEMKERLKRLSLETDRMLKNVSDETDFQVLRNFLSETSRRVMRPNEYPLHRDYPFPIDPFRYPMISPNRRELYAFLDSLRQRSR